MSELLPGDRGWLGVNMRLDPRLVPPGYVAEARNARFNAGVIETRLGPLFPVWAQRFTPVAPPNIAPIYPWTTLHGLGLFNDPATKLDYLIVAAEGVIYRVHPYNAPEAMSLPAGVSIAGPVTFTQAGSRLICHRGFSEAPLWLQSIHEAWDFLPAPDPATGTQPMPRAERSTYFQGRLWIPKDDDTIAYSDFNDPTSYQAVTQEFYVNPGSADRIVQLAKVGRSTLVIFKTRSIHVLYGVYGDLSGVQADTLTLAFGCVAAESVVDVGNEIWFLSQDGLRSLVHSEFGQFGSVQLKKARTVSGEEVPVVLSDPVKPLFDRINPRYVSQCWAAYWDRRYYIALPLDAAEVVEDNLLPATAYYDPVIPFSVVAGATYRLHGTTLDNGGTTEGEGDFVAAGASVLVDMSGTDMSLRRVRPGVMPTVAVYDFQNGAWAGHDIYQFGIERLLTCPVLGRDQLLAVTDVHWIAALEQDYQDARANPALDLEVTNPNAATGSAVVNGATAVWAWDNGNPPVNAVGGGGEQLWGVEQVGTVYTGWAKYNLFTGAAIGGFNQAGVAPWVVSNVRVYPTATGIRFESTTGSPPTWTINFGGVTVREVRSSDIELYVRTRAYTRPDGRLLTGLRAEADVQTWAADLAIAFHTTRVADTHAVSAYAPDRTHWLRPANRAPFDGANASEEFMEPDREDYSLQYGPDGTATFYFGADGVQLELHQEVRLAALLPGPDRWAAGLFEIVNTRGRLRVMGLALASDAVESRTGRN